STDGVRLVVGDTEDFHASVVLLSRSFGNEEGKYEMLPVFDGKEYPIMGYLELKDAMSIAQAIRERDFEKFKERTQNQPAQ
ncbi:MAG: hypothetical protein QMD97_02505, partial [Candidatus Aenigmarchaeota archaeon]|nr:hypothetical protein [Candidatus Aenigmarchaeota archaeon]